MQAGFAYLSIVFDTETTVVYVFAEHVIEIFLTAGPEHKTQHHGKQSKVRCSGWLKQRQGSMRQCRRHRGPN